MRYDRCYAPTYLRVDDAKVHQKNNTKSYCLSRLNFDASSMGECLLWKISSMTLDRNCFEQCLSTLEKVRDICCRD